MSDARNFARRKRLSRPSGVSAALARGVCDAVAIAAAIWFCWLFCSHHSVALNWKLGLCLAAALFLASAFVAIHLWKYWAQPIRALQQSLARIREGKVSIDDADGIGGGLRGLADELQQLLRQLRSHRAQVAMLEQEMGRRIAQRTDALQRVVGSLRLQMSRDPLTGLQNRRILDDCLDQLMQDARRNDTPLCLLMIDIDDFKALNDTLGHIVGDDLLRSFGQLVRCNLREGDLAFRCGGDEFVILLPSATRQQGEAMGQRLISLIDALAKTLHVPRRPRLSIGLAMPGDLGAYPTPTALLAQADKQLYQVKSRRKMQLRQSADPQSPQSLSA